MTAPEGMTKTGGPIPAGYHSLAPYLAVDHAACAIDFYRTAFGVEQISPTDSPDGGVMFAVLRIGDSNVELGEPLAGVRHSPRTVRWPVPPS
ncbi:MAG TPA: VOC family protein [Jiangellaceae bacterium]|nr:VOC family protein [Jiangellaceae bacterium]